MSEGGRPRLGLLLLGSRPVERLVSIARHAEACGFDYVVVPDERFYRDVYVILARLADRTRHVGLGPCVTDPYSRRPALTATALATLDELSRGRALLGMGAGISGFRELGIVREPPPELAVRGAVETVRGMVAGDATAGPRLPFQPYRPAIPVYLAAEGPRMLRLAGEIADAVILQAKVTEALFSASMHHVAAGVSKAGRRASGVAVVARVDLSVAAETAESRAVLRRTAVRRLFGASRQWDLLERSGVEIPGALRDVLTGQDYLQDSPALDSIADLLTDQIIDSLCIAATEDDLGARLDGLVRLGATEVLINPVAHDDAVEPALESAGRWRSQQGALAR